LKIDSRWGVVYKDLPVTPSTHELVKIYASTGPMNMREAASTLIMIGLRHTKDYENDRGVPHITLWCLYSYEKARIETSVLLFYWTLVSPFFILPQASECCHSESLPEMMKNLVWIQPPVIPQSWGIWKIG